MPALKCVLTLDVFEGVKLFEKWQANVQCQVHGTLMVIRCHRVWEATIHVMELIAVDGKSLAKDLWRSWSISPSIAKRAEERHIDHICSI